MVGVGVGGFNLPKCPWGVPWGVLPVAELRGAETHGGGGGGGFTPFPKMGVGLGSFWGRKGLKYPLALGLESEVLF